MTKVPDWKSIYEDCAHEPDRDQELLTITRETARLARSALQEINADDYYHNNGAAQDELTAALSPQPAAGGLGCRRCGRPYSLGPDLVVSDVAWAAIAPEGGGVLCPNCMHDAFEALGVPAGSIEAAFTSGPFANRNWKKPSAEAAQQPSDLVKRLRVLIYNKNGLYRHEFDTLLESTCDEAAARIEALEAVAKQAADWFEEYEKIHAAKGDIESDAKARRNADRAAFCRAALTAERAPGGRGSEAP